MSLRLAIAELSRTLRRSDARLMGGYLRNAGPKGLHIGCGGRLLDGWLNVDLDRYPGVARMDATRRFPFADETFDHIYSEHMIEHVPYEQGCTMLAECCRVLKPGGIVRIVTPDLVALAALCDDERDAHSQRYLDFFYETFLGPQRPHTVATALDAHFRWWGHSFLYDGPTLIGTMEQAGFINIEPTGLQDSSHASLCGLANDSRYPDGLLAFESMTFEGRKP